MWSFNLCSNSGTLHSCCAKDPCSTYKRLKQKSQTFENIAKNTRGNENMAWCPVKTPNSADAAIWKTPANYRSERTSHLESLKEPPLPLRGRSINTSNIFAIFLGSRLSWRKKSFASVRKTYRNVVHSCYVRFPIPYLAHASSNLYMFQRKEEHWTMKLCWKQHTDAVAKHVPQSPTVSTVMLSKAVLITGTNHSHIDDTLKETHQKFCCAFTQDTINNALWMLISCQTKNAERNTPSNFLWRCPHFHQDVFFEHFWTYFFESPVFGSSDKPSNDFRCTPLTALVCVVLGVSHQAFQVPFEQWKETIVEIPEQSLEMKWQTSKETSQ